MAWQALSYLCHFGPAEDHFSFLPWSNHIQIDVWNLSVICYLIIYGLFTRIQNLGDWFLFISDFYGTVCQSGLYFVIIFISINIKLCAVGAYRNSVWKCYIEAVLFIWWNLEISFAGQIYFTMVSDELFRIMQLGTWIQPYFGTIRQCNFRNKAISAWQFHLFDRLIFQSVDTLVKVDTAN